MIREEDQAIQDVEDMEILNLDDALQHLSELQKLQDKDSLDDFYRRAFWVTQLLNQNVAQDAG